MNLSILSVNNEIFLPTSLSADYNIVAYFGVIFGQSSGCGIKLFKKAILYTRTYSLLLL
jgi:hypothetical protein